MLAGDFNNSLSDGSSKLKISKETSGLKYTTHQWDLTDIYRISHSLDKDYVLQWHMEASQKLITLWITNQAYQIKKKNETMTHALSYYSGI